MTAPARSDVDVDMGMVIDAVRSCIYGDDDTGPGIIDEIADSDEDLWAWMQALGSVRKGSWRLTEAAEKHLIRSLGRDALRVEDYILYVHCEPPERHIKDEQGLISYLGLSAGALAAFAPNQLRVGGLRAFAEEKGDDPDAVEARFIEWGTEDGPPKLKVNRMEYAPFWALDMKDGERRPVPEKRRR